MNPLRHLGIAMRSGWRWWYLARQLCRAGGAHQLIGELAPFLACLADHQPKTVLEIGIADGGSLAAFAHAATADAHLIGIDPNPSPRAESLIRSHMKPDQTLKIMTCSSAETLPHIIGPLDFVFIDGDHHRASRDLVLVRPLVRPGGWIALHDIVPDHGVPGRDSGTVPELWSRLDGKRAFIEHPDQAGFGIGLMIKDDQ